jgi:dipeptidyl aminopeptidase/acylaminoacyl peptidase
MIRREFLARSAVVGGGLTTLPPLVIAQAGTTALSVEDFFRHDRYSALALSPNGQFLAAIAPVNGRQNVTVIDLKAGSSEVLTSLRERDVRRVRWINNERLVFDLIDLQSGLGEQRPSGLFAINRDGSAARELVSAAIVTPTSQSFVYRPTIPGPAVPDSNDIIVAAVDRSVYSFDLYRMDTRTGRKTLMTFDNPGFVGSWMLDQNLVPRLAIGRVEKSTRAVIYYRAGTDAKWAKLAEFDFLSNEGFDPIAFGPDDALYVAARAGRDKGAIYKYDVAANKLGEQIVSHKEFDFGFNNFAPSSDIGEYAGFVSNRNLIFDTKTKKLVGIRIDADREDYVWLDNDWARMHKMVNGALPNRVNRLSRSTDVSTVLVYSYSDKDPGRWYLLDPEKPSMQELVARRPWIRPERMGETRFIRYKARDGVEIPAYLTLPPGRESKNLPLILVVHGGPFVRGEFWNWDREAQFLASRGYAVLQSDYRGSYGYGWKHHMSGRRQWGLAMQDDLTDGVAHLVAQGIADKNRVAIMGGSYGGYAVMMGLAKDPDLYRCGINIVGVTDLELMGSATWSDMGVESREFQLWFSEHVGNLATEKERLASTSPARLAERIKKPVLIAHGFNDVRVPIEHAERMRTALQRVGRVKPEWVVYQDEAHGFLREKNNFDFYARVEKFLSEHMA